MTIPDDDDDDDTDADADDADAAAAAAAGAASAGAAVGEIVRVRRVGDAVRSARRAARGVEPHPVWGQREADALSALGVVAAFLDHHAHTDVARVVTDTLLASLSSLGFRAGCGDLSGCGDRAARGDVGDPADRPTGPA
ncbi:hypothetical protein, partial [Pseudonocardia sp. Ae356_Ps1]|uniref:hypothetical protein n=1 Tax=Pseudonocardia sp. Ae356_Ps1 TaxID=1885032 RepID=UPI001C37A37F